MCVCVCVCMYVCVCVCVCVCVKICIYIYIYITTVHIRLINLRAHFKHETCITKIKQLNVEVPYKIKNKRKWTPYGKYIYRYINK